MRMIILGSRTRARVCAAIAALAGACALAACSGGAPSIPPSDQPLSSEAMMLLGRKGMDQGAPIFVRIFKQESELEVWKARDDGRFYHFKTYPICNWSGDIGPKTTYGDHQAPEGFYRVTANQMNPNSQYYLAFNLGYPNAYDRSLQRTGDALMVHGKCKSVGCYAMTDALIEEIFGLAREALKGGQESFEVHAFPFRMSDENMARYKDNPNYTFWQTMKQGYDYFEKYRLPPAIAVCDHKYVVNVKAPVNATVRPDAACPRVHAAGRRAVRAQAHRAADCRGAYRRARPEAARDAELRCRQADAGNAPPMGPSGRRSALACRESTGSNPPPTSPQ